MPGSCPEDLVQGCDGGDSQEPAVCRWGSLPPEVGICPGVPLHVPSLPFEITCFSWLSSKPCWLTNVKLRNRHQEFKLVFPLVTCQCVIHRSFFRTWVFIKLISNFEISSCLFSSPVFLVQLVLREELDTCCILYCTLYCSLCIQKEADSKFIREVFSCWFIMSSPLGWQKSWILHLPMQETLVQS